MIRIFVITILHLSALISLSKADDNLIVVDNNTDKTIDSIIINSGESATFCTYKEVGIDKQRIAIPVYWYIPSLIDSYPKFSSCLVITGIFELKDKIIAKSEDGDSIVIPITVLPGQFQPNISINMITPLSKITIRDTIRLEVSVYNENGPISGNFCIDSLYFDLVGNFKKDILSEILVNNHKKGFKTYLNQCFYNGRDTIDFIIKDSSFIDNIFCISISFKGMTVTTQKIKLLPVSGKSNRPKYLNNLADLVSVTDRRIRFRKKIDFPLIISITNINGQLIHRGIHIADKDLSQYQIPVSMMADGCYVVSICSQKAGVVYSGILLQSQ